MDPDKLKILQDNVAMRDQEIRNYQINIDNYTRSVNKIDIEFPEDNYMQEFKKHLENLLVSERREQAKCKVIRDVMIDQINEATN